MLDLLHRPSFLIIICACGYAFATVWMKAAATTPGWPVLLAIAICLTAAVFAEVLLLRSYSLGLIYLAIVVTETILVMTAAQLLGDGLTVRQLVGAAIIMVGATIVTA